MPRAIAFASSTTLFTGHRRRAGAPSMRCAPSPSPSTCIGLRNIAVVHHSHCGATTFTADGLIRAWQHEHAADIAGLYDRGSICIGDYEASLKRDTALIRSHAGTPMHANIFGYFYDIDTGDLTEVVHDEARLLEPA
jgi:carbonic anhydrase